MTNQIAIRQDSPMTVMGIQIGNIEQVVQVCGMLAKSGAAPAHFNTAEKALAGIMYGRELGLGPWQSLQSLYPVRGKYSLMGIDMLGMIQASGLLENMTVEDIGEPAKAKAATEETTRGVRITLKRKGQESPYVGQFTVGDAIRGGLMGKDTYKGHPRDMLYWRAFARAARGFADVTKGLVVYEDYRDVEPQKGTLPEHAVMADADPLLIEAAVEAPGPVQVSPPGEYQPSADELAKIEDEEKDLKF